MVRLQLESIAQEAIDLNLAKAGYTAFYVDGTNGLNSYPGDSWEQPFKTIQHAVDEAESWCKIFVKAGTYDENVVIPNQGMQIIGEKIDTTIIKPSSGRAISSTEDATMIQTLTAVGNGTGSANSAVHLGGTHSTAKDIMVGNQNTSGYGLVVANQYDECDGILIDQSNKPDYGIWFDSKYGTLRNCIIENVGKDGIVLSELSCYWNSVHNNTIIDAGRYGISVFGMGCDYNTIFHNNIINSTTANVRDTTGATNKFFENFYDDHTTDTDNTGLCDSAYSFTTGTDHQPVSQRNGWNQCSLSSASACNGEYTGTVSAGTSAKTTVKEITATERTEIKGIWLDLTLLVTAGATIELEHKIDGTTYRVFETDTWGLADDDGVFITGFVINNDLKISITGGEAAGVDIPYNIIYQNMER